MAEMDGARYLCSQLVAMDWDGGTGTINSTVNLEEIHEGGAVVESDTEAPLEARVEIHCGNVCFAGHVTRAEEHAFGWRITLEFSPLTPWSLQRFRPEHLFDPAKMASGG